MPFLAKDFANEMSKTIINEFADINFDYVCDVPMSKYSMLKRGYNQSKLIALELSKILSIEFKELLIKAEHTKPQKEQNAKERKVNLFGAFDVIDKNDIKDKTILIVDDVKTTGSTLNECSKMLNIYGAKAVYAATFTIVNNNVK